MLIVLPEVLAAEDVARVLRELDGAAWRDGKATAGPAARAAKDNLQAPGMEALGSFVQEALKRHPLFNGAARARRISPILFSKYEPGMRYGSHTDDALMGPPEAKFRTDLAFTLFLSDPASYEGGALTIEAQSGEQAVRLPAGDAVLYPAGSIHHVEPLRSGARLAAVGWVESYVRDAARREILFDLALTRSRLAAGGGAQGELLRLDKSISNLLRMWAET